MYEEEDERLGSNAEWLSRGLYWLVGAELYSENPGVVACGLETLDVDV